MITKRALLVGINEYPAQENILAACLNDVNDFGEFLVRKCNFKYDNVRLLTERRATREEILKRLAWLVRGLKAGDRAVFLYSGHGNRLATRNSKGHVDKYYECICPYDFDWDGKNNISDTELCEIFSRMPSGVKLIWISDSCYSGGLSELERARDVEGKLRGKTIELPVDIFWRVKTAVEKGIQPLKMSGVVDAGDVILISATKERQQAQEKSFQGEIKLNGLLVYFLLEELGRENGLNAPLMEVMANVVDRIKRYGRTSKPRFDQEPVLHGRSDLIKKAFLK
jgi:metacaspase-1